MTKLWVVERMVVPLFGIDKTPSMRHDIVMADTYDEAAREAIRKFPVLCLKEGTTFTLYPIDKKVGETYHAQYETRKCSTKKARVAFADIGDLVITKSKR